jgi:hypothetical protein
MASLGAGLVRVCSSFYFKLNDTPLPNEITDDICVGLLNRVQCIFSLEAQRMLEVPIIEEELTSAIHALAKGKCLALDGLMVDFFKAYYNFTSVDFTTMVNESLECGCFPKGDTSGLNSLLFKQGKRWRLTNWQRTIAL